MVHFMKSAISRLLHISHKYVDFLIQKYKVCKLNFVENLFCGRLQILYFSLLLQNLQNSFFSAVKQN